MEKDETGKIVRLLCTWFEDSRSGVAHSKAPKVRGTIHWVDADASVPVEARSYDRLFSVAEPGEDFVDELNSDSLVTYAAARIEPCVRTLGPSMRYQFTRLGYYWQDPSYSTSETMIFNCIVPLRDARKKPAQPVQVRRQVVEPQPDAASPELSVEDKAWLASTGLSVAVGLAIRQFDGGEQFFRAASASADAQSTANWMANQLLPALKGSSLPELAFGPAEFARFVTMVDAGNATAHEGRAVLSAMVADGGSPEVLLKTVRAGQVTDPDQLTAHVEAVLHEFADRVKAYHQGKTGLAGFFVGQVLKRVRGKASPHQVKAAVDQALGRLQ